MKEGDIVRCVRPGMWERKFVEENPNCIFVVTDTFIYETGEPYVRVRHILSGKKHSSRIANRYKKL